MKESQEIQIHLMFIYLNLMLNANENILNMKKVWNCEHNITQTYLLNDELLFVLL